MRNKKCLVQIMFQSNVAPSVPACDMSQNICVSNYDWDKCHLTIV